MEDKVRGILWFMLLLTSIVVGISITTSRIADRLDTLIELQAK